MNHELVVLAATIVGLLCLAGVLHALPRLGAAGKAMSRAACRAPLLDVVVFAFTTLAPVAALAHGLYYGLGGLRTLGLMGVAVVGMVLALILWTLIHELVHWQTTKGPRIVKELNKLVGPARNHVAVYWTALAVPIFTLIRLGELIIYPPLTWLIRLPRYDSSKWVSVSRQKYEGLVGHDRIWCLYCDWMTGVWSLGGEMLRNVESFWCPIRFGNAEKCENCKHDFPDVVGGWASEHGSVADAAAVVRAKYPGPGGDNSWFGHPSRAATLTIDGAPATKKPTPKA
jgi:hypothetical protein